MKFTVLILVFILGGVDMLSTPPKVDYIDSISIDSIVDASFKTLIEEFVDSESKHSYFNSNSNFYMFISKELEITYFQLISGNNNDTIFVAPNPSKKKLGVFFYNDHPIVVRGMQNAPDSIFNSTGRHYPFYVFTKAYENWSMNELQEEDDSYLPSNWIINYSGGEFHIMNKFPMQGEMP